ncbi:helix-turn-helix transcriptional regulator [Pollutimonas bauzanensis]|uniref:Addiction module antidote protein, HigA family n=1 Tax=Pollutimonas bauzanensis TaxID=658167 RepID=A0A1M5XLR4_9BURK|nr:addiction module antidote protein, HigA family [Pollutimonas bauzanensis]
MKNSHPGEFIQAEVMEPLSLVIEDAARRFGVPVDLLVAVLEGHAPIPQALADGLERAGFSTARFWMAL